MVEDKQAEPEPADTTAGPCNDDTSVVEHDTGTVDAAELAWSQADDDTDVIQRRSWHRTWGLATGIVACGSALAAGLWLAIPGFRTAQPNHVARPTVSAAPTTTKAVAPQASDAANDQLFLHRLDTDGFMMTKDPQMTLGFAHQVCNSLRQGEPEAQVVQWLAAASLLSREWAAFFVNDAKVSYPNCEAPVTTTVAAPAPPVTVTVTPAPTPTKAAAAQVPMTDSQYIDLLTANGLTVGNPANGAANGHHICRDLADGRSTADISAALRQSDPGLTVSNANLVISLSIRAFCPQYGN
jgi:hypothetical protein